MNLDCDDKFLNSKVYFFFKYIFYHGVIPSKLNISHIIPIIKDKKKPNNSLNNLRPISISNTLAQIFERILLQKILLILIKTNLVINEKFPAHMHFLLLKRQ